MIISDLPEEVVFEVLLNLPIHLLFRCRGVSKSWKFLIDSHGFTKLHLDRSISLSSACCSRSKYIRAMDVHPNGFGVLCCKLYYADFDSAEEMNLKSLEINYPFNVNIRMDMTWMIHGSCRGLLCLCYSYLHVLLWNPLTNKQWDLPASPFDNYERFNRSSLYKAHYGFGYDDSTDDFKVVRVMKFTEKLGVPIYQEVKMYSLKSNSWKNLPLPSELPYFAVYRGTEGGFLVNHSLHWIMSDRDHSAEDSTTSKSDVIVALDIRTDKYSLIPLPPLDEDLFKKGWDLVILDGRLCVVSGDVYGLNMWIMNDYGRSDSWTNLILTPHAVQMLCYPRVAVKLVAFSKRLKYMVDSPDGNVVWYDIKINRPTGCDNLAKDYCILGSNINAFFTGFPFVGSFVNPLSYVADYSARASVSMFRCRHMVNMQRRPDFGATQSMTTPRRSARLQKKKENKRLRI